MNLIVIGTNHKFSSVEFRERLYFSRKSAKEGLDFLKEKGVIKGAVMLSTCNRVEIYASAPEPETAVEEIKNFISRSREVDIDGFSSYLYMYKGMDAVRHLFSVACGLDSLILGESQILEQVKSSLIESENAGFIDRPLKRIFDSVLSFADSIHQDKKVFSDGISIGSIVASFLKERFGRLKGKNILIIGTGKVIELIVMHLEKESPDVIFVTNRTFEKAKALASQINARAVRFNELKNSIAKADIVITATRSPYFIIKKEALEGMVGEKVLILDFALPRDVDPQVRVVKNVELFYLEDLKDVIEKNVSGRLWQAEELRKIIEIEIKKSCREYIELEPEPALLP